MFWESFDLHSAITNELRKVPEVRRHHIWGTDTFLDFIRRAKYAASLIISEKEIVTFALLQWVAIIIGYYVWVEILGWIPESVWRDENKLKNPALNIAFLVWSLICVGLVAYPVGILSGCMGAAHFLRKQGYPSTIAGCLNIVLPQSWALWMFHWIDAWITVDQILERLPKKKDRRSLAEKALSETVYYAWKVGSIGVVPSILCGHDLMSAGEQSIALVKKNIADAALLRGGYSLFCWIIGISAYIGSIVFLVTFPELFETQQVIYGMSFWLGVPIMVAVGSIELFVRPIYLISSCALYSDHVQEAGVQLHLPQAPARWVSALVVFGCLAILVGLVFVYKEELGMMKVLSVGAPEETSSPEVDDLLRRAWATLGGVEGEPLETTPSAEEVLAAQKLIINALRLDPHNSKAHRRMGLILSRFGSHKAALAEYRTAVRLKPDDPDAHLALGIELAEKQNYDAAIREFKRALKLNSDDPIVHYDLGVAFGWKGDSDSAIEQYREAIRFKPTLTQAYNAIGKELEKLKDYDGAIAEYRMILDQKPSDARPHYSIALALKAKGAREEAIQEFNEVLRVAPKTQENADLIQAAEIKLRELAREGGGPNNKF